MTKFCNTAFVEAVLPICLLSACFVYLNLKAVNGGQADPKRDFELVFENFTCNRPKDLQKLSSSSLSLSLKTKAKTANASRELYEKQLQKQQQQQEEEEEEENSNNIVQHLICGLNKNSKRRTLQMEMSFSRDLNEFQMNILIVLPRKRYNNDFILLNMTRMDGCQFLSNRNQVTLLQLARINLNHYANFPRDCPFLAETKYYLRNFRWNMDTLPGFAIETDIHIWFDYIVESKTILTGFIKARLELKSSRKDLWPSLMRK